MLLLVLLQALSPRREALFLDTGLHLFLSTPATDSLPPAPG